MSIDDLKSGDEIDSMISERVMGWPIIEDEPWEQGEYDVTDRTPCITNWWVSIDGHKKCYRGIDRRFFPSTDLDDAWKVIEEFQNKHPSRYPAFVEIMCDSWVSPWVTFGGWFFSMNAKDVATEICKAALKAMESK